MTAPRQMTATYLLDMANRLATAGISNEPGTQTTSMASSATPFLRSPSQAPATSFPTTTSLNRAATRTKRPAGGVNEPSKTGIRLLQARRRVFEPAGYPAGSKTRLRAWVDQLRQVERLEEVRVA